MWLKAMGDCRFVPCTNAHLQYCVHMYIIIVQGRFVRVCFRREPVMTMMIRESKFNGELTVCQIISSIAVQHKNFLSETMLTTND